MFESNRGVKIPLLADTPLGKLAASFIITIVVVVVVVVVFAVILNVLLSIFL